MTAAPVPRPARPVGPRVAPRPAAPRIEPHVTPVPARSPRDLGAVFAVPTIAIEVPRLAARDLVRGSDESQVVRAEALDAMRSRRFPPLLTRRDSRGKVILLSDPVGLMAARRLHLSHVPVVIINDSSPDLRETMRMIAHTGDVLMRDADETRAVATCVGMGMGHERIAAEFGRDVHWVADRVAETSERDKPRVPRGPRSPRTASLHTARRPAGRSAGAVA